MNWSRRNRAQERERERDWTSQQASETKWTHYDLSFTIRQPSAVCECVKYRTGRYTTPSKEGYILSTVYCKLPSRKTVLIISVPSLCHLRTDSVRAVPHWCDKALTVLTVNNLGTPGACPPLQGWGAMLWVMTLEISPGSAGSCDTGPGRLGVNLSFLQKGAKVVKPRTGVWLLLLPRVWWSDFVGVFCR